MNKTIIKISIIFIITAAAVLVYLPKPTASADGGYIGVYGFGFDSWEGRISPWPYPQQYGTNYLYAPNVQVQFQYIPIVGSFPGNDQISIDCEGNGTINASTGATASLTNIWGQEEYLSTSNLNCVYPTSGTYYPVIYATRTGGTTSNWCGWVSGSYTYPGDATISYTEYECNSTFYPDGITASTSYSPGGFNVYGVNYGVNIWPNNVSPYVGRAPQDLSFTVQATWQPIGYPVTEYISGPFNYTVDCLGDGTTDATMYGSGSGQGYVQNINYNSTYQPQGGSSTWQIGLFNTGPVCDYTNPGVYRALVGISDSATQGVQYGAADITLFPSKPLSVSVTAVPTTGDAPLNSDKIEANVQGLMPANGAWGPVQLQLRCDGNLAYEQGVAAGAEPYWVQVADGPDGQLSDVDNSLDYGDPGTAMVSTYSHTFTCNYTTAGTHTPTVEVIQNGLMAPGGTNVYVVGQLDCNSNNNTLKAPADYRLDWDTENTVSCNAKNELLQAFSGTNYSGATNWTGARLPVGSQTFYNVPAGTYEYDLDCLGNLPNQDVTSSCSVQVTP